MDDLARPGCLGREALPALFTARFSPVPIDLERDHNR